MNRFLISLLFVLALPLTLAQDVDLPILTPSEEARIQEESIPLRAPDPGVEPNDVPAPTFFGESINLAGDSLTYVIDRSGSMEKWVSLEEGPRLEVAKKEVARSLEGLDSKLKFNLIVFDCTIGVWSSAPQRATQGAKEDAISWLMKWRPGGGTGTAGAVVTALEGGVSTIVLLTDGQPNCPQVGPRGRGSEKWHRDKIRAANTGIPIHVFGVAIDDGWRDFCMGVASDSEGTFYEVR